MEVDTELLLKHLKEGKYKNEIKAYRDSMNKLPEYDNSRLYMSYAEDINVITQGDVLNNLAFINLPSNKIETGKGMIFSSTCDIELQRERKFPARAIYAPIFNLNMYEESMRKSKDAEGNPKFSDKTVTDHIQAIKDQKVGQIFYLPKDSALADDAIVYFDRVISCPNNSISRDSLSKTRVSSLSLYGWHVFMERLAHFFFKTTDETVELRVKIST